MSHRKFHAPRHGSLGFLPRKRASRSRGRVRSFPKDNAAEAPHFTAFMGYKAGNTHIVRDFQRQGSKLNNRDVVEPVTVIETPPLVVVGVVGYIETPSGLRALGTAWATHLSEDLRRRFYKNWYRSKKKAFKKYSARMETDDADRQATIEKLKKNCKVIRALAHTQIRKIGLRQKKAHIMEIQINGGSVSDKVDFVVKQFEREVKVEDVFTEAEMIDCIAVTKGKGTKGVVSRWGVARLPRKTHRGLRKVACIGAWHPSRVAFSVARVGQKGYHHRTEINKKIYRVGKGNDPQNASTEADPDPKTITPMGGFKHYGIVDEDFLLIKGGVAGPTRRVITLRKSLLPPSRVANEEPAIKFIDTSSKWGHGRFQTAAEKQDFFGPVKKSRSKPQTIAEES